MLTKGLGIGDQPRHRVHLEPLVDDARGNETGGAGEIALAPGDRFVRHVGVVEHLEALDLVTHVAPTQVAPVDETPSAPSQAAPEAAGIAGHRQVPNP